MVHRTLSNHNAKDSIIVPTVVKEFRASHHTVVSRLLLYRRCFDLPISRAPYRHRTLAASTILANQRVNLYDFLTVRRVKSNGITT